MADAATKPKTVVLLCRTYPAFRILNPDNGTYSQFAGGKLVIAEDDPNYAFVMAEAVKNPDIVVTSTALQCDICGETFTGGAARLELGKHRKNVHPIEWDADHEAAHIDERTTILKDRAGFPCDVCQPVQTFGTEADLAEHVRMLHGAPFVDADGRGVPDDVRETLGNLPAGG